MCSRVTARPEQAHRRRRVGAGSLASFAQPQQPWTYSKSIPSCLKLARDERYFTFLRDSRATDAASCSATRGSRWHANPTRNFHC